MIRRYPVRVALVLVLVVFAVLSIHQIRSRPVLDPNYAMGMSQGEVVIDIAQGESGSQIASKLFAADVVKSASAFFRVAVADPRSSQIAPGSHRLQKRIPAKVALLQLLDKARITSLVDVKEGAWKSEILDALVNAGFVRSELTSAMAQLRLPPGFTGSEGVLFPAQYSFAKGTSALSALQSMADQFASASATSGISTATKEFTSMQLLTIASLLQAEGTLQDFPKISRVIRNRLSLGMPLQFDSTVHFVTHTRGSVFLSSKATQTPSAYNTYLHYGLPPGPIGSPGLAAMRAALTPATGDWIYFITVKPGDTRYTASSNEFLKWKSEYEANLRAGAFS